MICQNCENSSCLKFLYIVCLTRWTTIVCWPQDTNSTFCLTLRTQGSVPAETFYPSHPGMGATCLHRGTLQQSLVGSYALCTVVDMGSRRSQSSASQMVSTHEPPVDLLTRAFWFTGSVVGPKTASLTSHHA